MIGACSVAKSLKNWESHLDLILSFNCSFFSSFCMLQVVCQYFQVVVFKYFVQSILLYLKERWLDRSYSVIYWKPEPAWSLLYNLWPMYQDSSSQVIRNYTQIITRF